MRTAETQIMGDVARAPRMSLPVDLERRLLAFRGVVWRIKLVEAIAAAVCGVLIAYLLLFCLDRLVDTPRGVRGLIAVAAVLACAAVPFAFHRWIWNHRGLDQVARLIARRFPSLGDQLLGIIEIVRGESAAELARSPALCEAAIDQVAERAARHDFATALPRSRHRLWLGLAAVPVVVAAALAAGVPAAAANAWARLLAPWQAMERYTFTRLDRVPERLVVPRGEPAALTVALAPDTRWRPEAASVRIGRRTVVRAERTADAYTFALPPQLEPATLAVAAGDARARVAIEPMLRPEIVAVQAEVRLPGYLGREGLVLQDVRGGTVGAVKGSSVAVVATADRELAAATVDGVAVSPVAAELRTPAVELTAERTVAIGYRDRHGLDGGRPLTITLAARDDAPPTLMLVDAPPAREILLDTDTLRFAVSARDDFGIKEVGLVWQGQSDEQGGGAAQGELLLQPGGSDQEALDAAATFSPRALGIPPQPVVIRAYAEDYLPDRGRVYSTPLLVYIVDQAEHALVVNERLNRWRQQAGEVRDRETGLMAINRELRALPAERLLEAETRRKLESQAAAEEANARRLDRLVDAGAALVREAMKNPEFEAETLEQLASDLQTLGEIADARMPGVAERLEKAARAQLASKAGQAESGKSPPRVGEDRGQQGGDQPGGPGTPKPPVPQVVDRESSQQPNDDAAQAGAGKQSGGKPRLGLPTTQAGVTPPKKPGEQAEDPPADEAIDQAIAAQEALLAEFAKVADDLAAVMARLEGSTFVKRFKLASREQATIGGRIAGLSAAAFADQEKPRVVADRLGQVVDTSTREAERVSNLMDDLQAYFDRRRTPAFETVLEEMKDLDALGSLRQLSTDIQTAAGLSIAQAEFWSDTFDRLADDLVPPAGDCKACKGKGGKGAESLPPDVVLEAMRILEAEVNLREETRVAQQARKGMASERFTARAASLAAEQTAIAERVEKLAGQLREAPVGELPFGKDAPLFGPLPFAKGSDAFAREIKLFNLVEDVMREAVGILESPDTGPKAMAAETEAIELLLASKACGGGGGGGSGGAGGMTPGGGSTGSNALSALPLVGRGNSARGGGEEQEKDQATGASGRVLPEEYRAGLDAYFNRFEKGRP
ncbi:MAG: hypothetical protein ACKOOF_07125 [Planctomycetaceae bacterium]